MKQLPDFLERHQIGLNVPVVDNQPEIVGDSINASLNGIQQVHWILENMKGVLLSSKENFKPEYTELKPFIEDCLKNEITNGNFKWYVVILDKTSTHAEIDKYQFKHIVRNLVSNAIRHGKAEKPVNFVVKIYDYSELLPEDDDSVTLEFINDGNPLPADFTIEDFIQFRKKAGRNKGQGIGGYLIHRIIQNHSGNIDIEPLVYDFEPVKGINVKTNVCFRINIPKNQ